MDKVLLLNSDINTALMIALVGVIGVIGSFVIAIFKNENLRSAVVGRLVGSVRGGQVVTVQDLETHDLKLKLNQLIGIGSHRSEDIIVDLYKAELYKAYLQILAQTFLDSYRRIIQEEYVNFTEGQLKELIILEMSKRRAAYHTQFVEYLLTLHHDRNQVELIARKIEKWRVMECDLISDNILTVISSGRHFNVAYKLDVIFYQYSLGIDMLLRNGADSFNRLNGELDVFFNKQKDE